MIENKKTRHSRNGFAVIKLLIVIVVLAIIGGVAYFSYLSLSQKGQSQSLTASLAEAAEKIEKYKSTSSIKAYPSSLSKAKVTDPEGAVYTYVGSNAAFCLSAAVSNDDEETVEEVYRVTNTDSTPATGDCADEDSATDVSCFETKAVDDGVEITAYKGGGGSFYSTSSSVAATCPSDIETPFTIDGKQVVSIGDAAFSPLYNDWAQDGFSITKVSIPDSVTSIGMSAFSSNAIGTIAIPDSVKTIGDYAFQGAGVSSVILSNAVTAIGMSAFQYNTIGSVTIPASVNTIGQYAFSNNSGISCIFLGDNKFTASQTGCYGETPSY